MKPEQDSFSHDLKGLGIFLLIFLGGPAIAGVLTAIIMKLIIILTEYINNLLSI